MYRDIFEEEMDRETVFRDASKLMPEYVPKELVHREEEFRQLTRFFKPVLENRSSQRVLVTGSVGVGKTALTRRFGAELERAANGRKLNLTYLHINCRKDKTLYSVIAKILQHFNPKWPYHGLGPEKLLNDVVTYLNAHDVHLTLTLDELDFFVQQNGPNLLYSLSRTAEESGGPSRISVIAIARDKSFLRSSSEGTPRTGCASGAPRRTPRKLCGKSSPHHRSKHTPASTKSAFWPPRAGPSSHAAEARAGPPS